jgi:hypothetical protein
MSHKENSVVGISGGDANENATAKTVHLPEEEAAAAPLRVMEPLDKRDISQLLDMDGGGGLCFEAIVENTEYNVTKKKDVEQ